MASAFTTSNSSICRSLRNNVVLKFGDKTMTALAVWDTGATNTCVSMDVVAALGAIATGKQCIRTPSGERESNTYLMDVILPNDVEIKDLMVMDSEIGSHGIGVLIGMDIITQGDFAVSNHDRKTFFTFRVPAEQHADYVKEIRIKSAVGPKHGPGKRKRKK